jgi:hypothetical protein
MIPEKVFHQILALGEAWRVRQVDYVEKESKVLIRVEETPAVWARQGCPHCQSKSVGGYDHAPARRDGIPRSIERGPVEAPLSRSCAES